MARQGNVMNRQHQAGMSMWSMALIALVAGFFVLIGIKMIPVYLNDMKIRSALGSLSRDQMAQNASKLQVREMLRKRLEVDMADDLIDMRKELYFESEGRDRIVRISYDSITPLFINISILVEFDHAEKVGTVGG